jgi:hypothetical protein
LEFVIESMAMSDERGKPCTRGCGAMVYFDKDSPTGHPSPDKWIPLEMKEGRRTDAAHNCPMRNTSNGSTLDNTTAAATTTPAIIVKPEGAKACRNAYPNSSGLCQTEKTGASGQMTDDDDDDS